MNKFSLTISLRSLGFALVGMLPIALAAQQGPAASQAEINQQLLQRIQDLEKEVQSLKGQPQTAAVAPPPAPAPPPEPVAEPPAINEVAPRLKLNFFGDVGYQAGHFFAPNNTFEFGEFDMFATARISDKVSLLGEILFNAGSDNSINVDVERLYLKYRHSEYFAATIGRIHT